MDNRFSLLRLPILAIEEVMRQMNPFEILNFARASSMKSKKLVQYVMKYRNIEIGIDIRESSTLAIHGPVEYQYTMTSNRDEDGVEKLRKFKTFPRTVYEKMVYSQGCLLKEFKEIVEFAIECLSPKIRSFTLQMDNFPGKNLEITDWVKSHFPSIWWVSLYGKDVSHQEANSCLEQLKSRNLSIYLETKNNQPVKVPKSVHQFHINPAKWVTLELLIEFNVVELRIWKGVLKNEELNSFIQKFQNLECHSNLTRFAFQIEKLEDFTAIVDGIDSLPVHPRRRLQIEENIIIEHPGVDIKRKDGRIATMFPRVFPVCPFFEMRLRNSA